MLAQPAFAASEIAQFAGGDSKAAADALLADYTQKRAIVQQAPKTKSLASKKAKKEAMKVAAVFPCRRSPCRLCRLLALVRKAAPAAKAAPAPAVAKEASGKFDCRVLGVVLRWFWSKPSLSRLSRD